MVPVQSRFAATRSSPTAQRLAFCASLMPIKVLSKHGFGSVANVAEGIRFAADEGAQVINLSLGGPIKSAILEDAVNHALSAGVVVVAAAGNSGRRVGWPAAYPGVVAVSATDDTDKIAWFSSRGPEIAIAARLRHPHILPLLDSGTSDGLPYYIMPHVEGETLRSRLRRERFLPIDDAIRIRNDERGDSAL